MKKILLFAILFVILLSNVALATVSLDVIWQASVETMRPGGDATISLTITNTGTTVLTNVVITPTGGPDVSATSGKIELGGIPAASSNQGSISIKVDDDAISRTSYVHLDVDYYTSTSTHEKTFKIPVTIRRAPILQIVNVNYNDTLSPGKTLE